MISNQDTLNNFFANGLIPIKRSPIFDVVPEALPANFNFSRIEGMMLGLAIGDALGNTSESRYPMERMRLYGEIKDYIPNAWADGQRIGLPSDDSQLSFWTLEQMIDDGGSVPANIARRFTWQEIYGIGQAVSEFRDNYYAGAVWYEAGARSAGNGAIMRIAPVIIPYLRNPSSSLWADTALLAMITHRDSASIASCLAFVAMLWELLRMKTAPRPGWYLQTYISVASALETAADYSSKGNYYWDFRGSISDFTEKVVKEARKKKWSVFKACEMWQSSAYLLETMPSVIYILMNHGHDPEEAIIRAVNDTWDNDTIGALVGTAMGALYGIDALPQKWIRNLSGRTGDEDDGRMCQLLAQARELWWEL